MSRRAPALLAVILLPAMMALGTPPPALGQVSEPEEEKQKRIDKFQDMRLIYELLSPSPTASGDTGKPKMLHLLRQGPDRIYDIDFVELMDDPSLTSYWEKERNRDFAWWLGIGLVGIPVGAMVLQQNFKGEGPLAPFYDPSRVASSPVPASGNASDWRAYTLSVAGGALALYGAYNLGLWASELLDLSHPNRLDEEAVVPRVRDWNDNLRDRLNLDPEDIPPPPSPRQSPSPSPSPSWFDDDPPPVVPPLDPYGEVSPVPLPLPVLTPGAVPSELVPSPRRRPFIFRFVPRLASPEPSGPPEQFGPFMASPSPSPTPSGNPAPATLGSPTPSMSAGPTPSKSASPKPVASPVSGSY